MPDNREYAEAAAALIRMYAETQRNVRDTYSALGETAATNRAGYIAAYMDYAAELLREKLDPPYDAKEAAASDLAVAVWRYLSRQDEANFEGLGAALEAYDAIEEN